MLSREEILSQTDDGMRVILHYLPQAQVAVDKKNEKFRTGFRENDKTASGSLWKTEKYGWIVKDWGEKNYSAFDLVMQEERVDYPGAIRFIIQHFDLEVGTAVSARSSEYERLSATNATKQKNGPEYKADEEVGTKDQRFMEGYTVNGMKTIFSKYVWEYMAGGQKKNREETDEAAMKVASKLCEKYGLKQLEWTSTVANDKKTGEKVKHVFYATDSYPIYAWVVQHGSKDAPKTWLKFYEPYGKQRFSSTGPKPENILFGEKQCLEAFDAIPNQEEILEKLGLIPDDYEADKDIFTALNLIWEKRKPRVKLNEIVVCSGGSDALNVAALGYQVIWFNSERINKTDVPFEKLSAWAYKVINLPDIDVTGKTEALEMAFHWIEMHTAWLPEELRSMKSGKKDDDGNPKYCKDVKDYLARYTAKAFGELLKEAKPFKFWTATPKYVEGFPVMVNGEVEYKYSPRPNILLNFLYHNGFGILASKSGDRFEYVRVDGNIVKRIADTGEIKTFIDDFIKKHSRDGNLQDAFLRSKDISDSIFSRLPKVSLDFKDFDKDYQYMFFQNEVWVIKADKIERLKPKSARKFVWEHEVVKPSFWCEKEAKRKNVEVDLLPDFFTITKDGEDHDIVVNEHNDLFFNYLINTSRIHWRTELEDNLDKSSLSKEEKVAYRERHKFDIAGPLLSDEERQQQKMNLIVKILTIGFMVHRYKRESNSKVVWSMDYVMRDINKSQGGTGKSLTPRGLKEVLPTEYLSGRDKGVLDNKHVFENVSEFTDMLWLDDAGRDTNFDFFFGVVTGPMKKNPKGTKSEMIDFEDSPKIWITSNFPPMKGDEDSTMRRIWFTAYSDFYHYNKSGEYRGEHKPEDDLGKQLFIDFDQDNWNCYLNFLAQCCKAYIKFGIVESNDQALMVNTYRNMIGPQFMDWANVYFNSEDKTLDYFLHKKQLHETYMIEVGDITANGFKTKLETWCKMKLYSFNPKKIEKGVQADGRIAAKQTHLPVYDRREGKWEMKLLPKPVSQEFVYIQSHPDEAINYEGMYEYKPKAEDNDSNANEPKPMPF